jgi:hypothetical protein
MKSKGVVSATTLHPFLSINFDFKNLYECK